MKQAAVLLILDSDCWRAVLVGDAGPEVHKLGAADLDESAGAAAELARVMEAWGCTRKEVCLALPSEMVLAARIDSANLPRRQRREALVYRLEEQLPIDAEQLTADFLPPVGGRVLGAAVETARVRAVVDQLTAVGIETVAVCPTAMLALWDALGRGAESSDYVIVIDPPRADIFRIVEGRPSAWQTTSCEPAEMVRCLQADMLAEPVEADTPAALPVGPLEGRAASLLERAAAVRMLPGDAESAIPAAARTAGAILAGQAAGWVNFRRDDLAMPRTWGRFGGLVKTAVILGCLLPAILAAAFYWRAARYEAMAEAYQDKQAAEFRSLYPNQPAPASIRSRFESEMKAMAAKSGTGFDLPARPCALETLRRVAAGLPPAVRLRIVEVRIDTAGILIEGQTRSHSDAEGISRALKRGGFTMAPPSTEHLVAGGVAFTLVGTLGSAEQSAEPGGKQP